MPKNRDWGVLGLLAYLLAWWGLVAALLVFITSNSAPGHPQLAWKDAETFTTTKLTVEIETDAPDADGDKVTYSYKWTKNGEPVPEKLAQSISSKDTMAGDVWEVSVESNDGTADGWGCSLPWRECAGHTPTKLAVTVGNTPPRARIGFINPSAGEDELASVVDWDGKSDLALDLSCFDPDVMDLERQARELAKANPEPEPEPEPEGAEGEATEKPEKPDPCTYTIQWWPADAEIEEGAVSEFTEPTMSARDLRAHDRWKVIVVANDGTEDGEPIEETIAKLED